jgi:hypothetical protein
VRGVDSSTSQLLTLAFFILLLFILGAGQESLHGLPSFGPHAASQTPSLHLVEAPIQKHLPVRTVRLPRPCGWRDGWRHALAWYKRDRGACAPINSCQHVQWVHLNRPFRCVRCNY